MMKILKWTFIGMMLLGACAGGFAFWVLYGSKTSNPYNYATVGSIAAPWGYERISGDDAAYTNCEVYSPCEAKDYDVSIAPMQ